MPQQRRGASPASRQRPTSRQERSPSAGPTTSTPKDMAARASRLVLERWRKRHQHSCHFASHKSLCRVPRTLVHVAESEGTHRFLAYLFEASQGLEPAVEHPSGNTYWTAPPPLGRGADKHRVSDVSANTDVAMGGGSVWDDEGADAFVAQAQRMVAHDRMATTSPLPQTAQSDVGGSTNSPSERPRQASVAPASRVFANQYRLAIAPRTPTDAQLNANAAAHKSSGPPLVLDIPERLRPQDLVTFDAIASTHPTLRAVMLRENVLDELTYRAFLKILKTNRSITHLGWKGHCRDGDGGRDVEDGSATNYSNTTDESSDDGDSDGPSEDEDGSDEDAAERDPLVLATLQKVRRVMVAEEVRKHSKGRLAQLKTFQDGHTTASPAEQQPTQIAQAPDQARRKGGAPSPAAGDPTAERRQRRVWVRNLQAIMQGNRKHVAERKKAQWVRREVQLYARSVDAFCTYIQSFVVAERSLRTDLVAMEERQRQTLISTVAASRRDAQRRDRIQRLIRSIEDRLVWVVGREGTFRQMLWEDYHDDVVGFCLAMEVSRREAIVQTEVNSRLIMRTIGNTSWATSTREEKERKEAQRLAKLAVETEEDHARWDVWQVFVRELRRFKAGEVESRESATAATVIRMDKERRELVMAKRQEEQARERAAREAREQAHQRLLHENAQRRDRERHMSDEVQARGRLVQQFENHLRASFELFSTECALLAIPTSDPAAKLPFGVFVQLFASYFVPIMETSIGAGDVVWRVQWSGCMAKVPKFVLPAQKTPACLAQTATDPSFPISSLENVAKRMNVDLGTNQPPTN